MKLLLCSLLLINIINAQTFNFGQSKVKVNKTTKNYIKLNTNLEYCSLDKNYKSKCINKKNQKEEIKND